MRLRLARLLVVALLAAGCPSDDRAPRQEGEPALATVVGAPAEVRFEAGRAYRYRLRWNVGSHAELASEQVLSAPLDGRIGIEGVLELRAHGDRDGRSVLSARLRDLEGQRMELGGQPLLPAGPEGRRMLEDQRAVVQIDRRGRVVDVAFDPDAAPIARHVLGAILGVMHVELPDAGEERWEISQDALYGRQRVRYELDPSTDPASLIRTRLRYETFTGVSAGGAGPAASEVQLRGGGRLRFAAAGHLVSLEDEERTRTGDGAPTFASMEHLTLHLLDEGRFDRAGDPLPREGLVRVERAQPTTFDRAIARSFAEGLTADQMAVDLLALGRGMPMPRLSTVRMVGLVRADDDAARSLVPLFSRRELGQSGRARVTDVLSSAGTPVAQAALRQVLDTPQARRDRREQSMLLQRFSLVRHPTAESAEWVWNELGRARRDDNDLVERAAIFCMGSVVGHLYEDGRDDLAARYERELAAGLAGATDDDSLEAYLAGFGNIARPGNLEAIVAHADHPSSTVRAQVATSLRLYEDAEARQALVELAGDDVGAVAVDATRSLGQRPLTRADFERLAEASEAGRIHGEAHPALMNLVASHRGAKAAKIRILEAMLERVSVPRQRAQIQRMRDDLRGR